MSVMTDTANLMNQPGRIRALRRAVETVADGAAPLVDLCRPFVDGLEHLPRDGRFLLVGNHTQSGTEAFLIPYVVRRELGTLVRPLTDRAFSRMPAPAADLLAACGATVGAPESARELMRHDQPILVFPGGGREIGKFKGEENTLNWRGRAGFARIAAEHDYPIVPAGLIGGDDVYRSFTTRDGAWGRFSANLSNRLAGKPDMAMPLVRGIGPTMVPRPQRMYLRFAEPIDPTRPAGVAADEWADTVKARTQRSLEAVLAQLLEIRGTDPYRHLNPLAWRDAIQP
ncbi:lysophospholipid acyltransferase family protein [Mycolicibacterium sp. PDY-3]|uniref:lysophospholipid acyltransferase family protein n=1 Tax=Mycolicibacterium sp. PDY-3 TaxID=3376069 RepID=UPI00378CB3C1